MASWVVDANVIVALHLTERSSEEAERALGRLDAEGAALEAPDLLLLEAASAIWKRVRREQLEADQATAAFARVLAHDLRLHGSSTLASPALGLAIAHGLSPYDGSYLALALLLGAPLLTLDRRLATRGSAAGVRCLGPAEVTARKA